LKSVGLGFNSENLLLVQVNARRAGYKDDALMRFYDNLQTRFRGITGVRSASLSNYAMVSNSVNSTNGHIPGQPATINDIYVLTVGPNFFGTMQIPILLGREILDRDNATAPRAAVVNEVFAQKCFGSGNPVGKHFILGGGKTGVDYEIVGVSKTTRFDSLKDEIPKAVFVPYSQNQRQVLRSVTYELRATGDPLALASAARRVLRDADSRIPVSNISTQSDEIAQTIGQERTFATLCTCFAVLAVAIAFVGLYGMMAYNVARRTNEIGIRMALGAERSRLMWAVLREVIGMALIGLAIGLPVALVTTKFVGSFLFQMKPNDPSALCGAAAILLAAAFVAGYGPAWRASRVDPWTALRDE
jgi:predicted permease